MIENQMFIKTGQPWVDDMVTRVQGFLACDVIELNIDGEKVTGYRSPDARSLWIRDHSDMMRIGKYLLDDPKSAVRHFAETQAANGRVFDYVTTFPEKLPCERENWTKYVRVPVEADVEFRFIKAAFLAWQASGDDDWIRTMLPHMERALEYIFSHPHRWDEESGLVKRAYTIDTWDFAYTAGQHEWLQFQINDDTYWGIFHGDNSGYFEALKIMEILYCHLSDQPGEKLTAVRQKRAEIGHRTNSVCWNGNYYTHFSKITPVTVHGVDESIQLSMANPMSINRGLATHEMAVSIIQEYLKRKETTNAFAEWFSIDPPFPDGIFGDEKLVGGAYINGGIFPLAGGELAMAAFEHGFEAYGVSILRQYYDLISLKNETYLWYFPDGTPTAVETSTSPEAMPTDGWGSSAMLWALLEGLAGVKDLLKQFQKVRLSPRWVAAGILQAEVDLGYPSMPDAGLRSTEADREAGFRYRYEDSRTHLDLSVEAVAAVDFHVMIRTEQEVSELTVNGLSVGYEMEWIEESRYVNFSAQIDDQADIRINFKR